MAFRNPIRRMSQLVADTVIGAVLQTADAFPYIKIYQASLSKAVIQFWPLKTPYSLPGEIYLGEAGVVPTFSLTLAAPESSAGRQPSISLVSGDSPGSERERIELVADEGVLINGLGSLLRGADWGVFTGNTNATGDVTVPHDLGAIPTGQFAQPTNGASPWQPWRLGHTANDVTWRMRNADTNAVAPAGTSVTFFWLTLL